MLSDLLEEEWLNQCGLVGIGGDLSPRRLLKAYRSGVFPWYDESTPVLWWSPDPRAIFEFDGFRPSRRLRRIYRSGRYRLTINRCFRRVMEACAVRPDESTWITPEMLEAYERLHRLGHAHSIEAWQEDELVGGVYGVAIGGFFAGESMFHRRNNAGDVALMFLMSHLRRRGYVLFDTQFVTEHTSRLGAIEIPRKQYLERLRHAIHLPVTFLDQPRRRRRQL